MHFDFFFILLFQDRCLFRIENCFEEFLKNLTDGSQCECEPPSIDGDLKEHTENSE